MGIITHRALEEVDCTAMLGEFLQEHHLMDIVAGEAIRGRDEYPFKDSESRAVAQGIQAWAVELRSAVAIITVDVLLGEVPVGLGGHPLPQTRELVFNGLVLLLTVGGHAYIEGHFDHAMSPRRKRAGSLGCAPQGALSSGAVVDTLGPTAVDRCAGGRHGA